VDAIAEQSAVDTPEEYRERRGLNSGSLMRWVEHGTMMDEVPVEHKPIFDNGHYLEALIDGSARDRFAFAPKIDRRTKAGKAEYAAFLKESEGKVVIAEEDAEVCRKLADSAMLVRPFEGIDTIRARDQLLTVSDLMPHLSSQLPIYWEHEGIKKKALADAFAYLGGLNIILDWKWTGNLNTFLSGLRYNKWLQAEHYSEGASVRYDDQTLFVYIVCEAKPPYVARAVTLDPGTAGLRRAEYLDICEEYARWNRKGRKPTGYGEPKTVKIWV